MMAQSSIIFDLSDSRCREYEQARAHEVECHIARMTMNAVSMRHRIGRWLISTGERVQGGTSTTFPPLSTASGPS
jgi:hypothetical protein